MGDTVNGVSLDAASAVSPDTMNDVSTSLEAEGFHLLAREVESLEGLEGLTLEGEESEEEDFEVIPFPHCFNLEVPFEVVEDAVEPTEEEEEEEEEEDEATAAVERRGNPLEEALVAVRVVQEKLDNERRVSSILDNLSEAAVEAASVEQLVDLGFANRAENIKLLRQSGNDMEKVLKKLFVVHGSTGLGKGTRKSPFKP